MILRESIEDNYKWGIDEMFPNIESWDKEYFEIDQLIKSIKSYSGNIPQFKRKFPWSDRR